MLPVLKNNRYPLEFCRSWNSIMQIRASSYNNKGRERARQKRSLLRNERERERGRTNRSIRTDRLTLPSFHLYPFSSLPRVVNYDSSSTHLRWLAVHTSRVSFDSFTKRSPVATKNWPSYLAIQSGKTITSGPLEKGQGAKTAREGEEEEAVVISRTRKLAQGTH